jgi:hypothetical protein
MRPGWSHLLVATTGCRTRFGDSPAFVSGRYFRIADGGIDGRRGLRGWAAGALEGAPSVKNPNETHHPAPRGVVLPGGWRHSSSGRASVDTSSTAMLRGRTIATIIVAAPTMYPPEALPGDVYARDGEELARSRARIPWPRGRPYDPEGRPNRIGGRTLRTSDQGVWRRRRRRQRRLTTER